MLSTNVKTQVSFTRERFPQLRVVVGDDEALVQFSVAGQSMKHRGWIGSIIRRACKGIYAAGYNKAMADVNGARNMYLRVLGR
jgi:hypothetical protein